MTDGIVTMVSPRTVDDTLARLREILAEKQLTVFAVVDHSGEAAKIGLSMANTKLVVFGSPAAGTPVMQAAPLAALDLPLKLLVWDDGEGTAHVSYNDPAYLAERHHLSPELASRLAGVATIAAALLAP